MFTFFDAINILVIVIITVTAYLILKKKSRKGYEKVYLISAFTMALWPVSLFFYNHPIILNPTIWLKIVYLVSIYFQLSTLSFVYLFPRKIPIKGEKIVGFILVLLTILFGWILFTTDSIVQSAHINPNTTIPIAEMGHGYVYYNFFIMLISVFTFIVVVKKYKLLHGLEKLQIKFFTLAILSSGMIIMALVVVPPLLFNETRLFILSPIATVPYFVLVSYSIVKLRLFDIRFIFSRVIVTAILSFFLYLTFFGIIDFTTHILHSQIHTSTSHILGLFIAPIFLLFFLKFREVTNDFIGKRVLPTRFNPEEELQNLISNISTELEIGKIAEHIKKSVTSPLTISSYFIILVDKDEESRTFSLNDGFSTDCEQTFQDLIPTISKLSEKVILFDELSIGIDVSQGRNGVNTTQLKEYMKNYSVGAILNLDINAQIDGFVLIGNKEEGAAFTENEVRYLRSILSNASIAIERALLYNKVQSFNITLQNRVDKATEQLQERNEELQDLYNNLEEIYQKEKDLMDVAGHEFRTPASILKNNLYLLKKRLNEIYPDKPDEKINTYIDRLVEGTDRQIKLVNTFLESARIDNKRFDIQVDLVDIGETIEDAVADMKHFAKKKGIQVIFHRPQKKVFVEIDTVRMREVIDNLLNNAVKYTDKGYIEVTLTDKPESIIFTVKDTGIGIKRQDQAQLFKKFSRVENYIGGETGEAAIVRPGGTGLGLYVAKTIIVAHGGTIDVDSDIGKGSVFTFEIPKKQPSYVKRAEGSKTKLETKRTIQ